MRTVCQYCKLVLVEGSEENGVSHGICSPCLKREIEDLENLYPELRTNKQWVVFKTALESGAYDRKKRPESEKLRSGSVRYGAA